jgi:hypothetical protein
MGSKLHLKIAVGAALAVLAAGGCSGEQETKPLDTKDLPAEMKVQPNDPPVQPSGNQFKNPRDAAGAGGGPAPKGR